MEVKRGPRAFVCSLRVSLFHDRFLRGFQVCCTHRSPIRLLCPSRVPLHEFGLRFEDHFELRRFFSEPL